MKLWARYCLALTIMIAGCILLFNSGPWWRRTSGKYEDDRTDNPLDGFGSYVNSTAIQFLDKRLIREFEAERDGKKKNDFAKCSMTTCFNYTKCMWKPFRVYVYPTAVDLPISPVYEKILRVIRDSAYYTEQPDEACLFVLSLDTADRDWRSDNYIRELGTRIAALPTDLWNGGRNHVIFNLYYGTYPDYSVADVGFDAGQAIMAWASAGASTFRDGFDVSFPLFHAEHPLRRRPSKPVAKNPWHDRHLVSFKGKRYVYGIGSRTRDSLYHLHNNHSTIIATTCRHNADWKKFEDARCSRDNREYDRYNYGDLLGNSSFCLTPRGRRLGSFRFLESLKAGCIPVILSDGWELPFSELVDWSKAAIVSHEKAVYFTTDWLANISIARIARMKRAAQVIYHRYFSSVEKIVLTTIEIISKRVRFVHQPTDHLLWSRSQPLEPKFTAVIQATKRFSSRLTKIIVGAAEMREIEKLIVLWPRARGAPPESSAFAKLRQPVEYVKVNEMDQRNFFNLDDSKFTATSDFLVTLDERLKFNANELRLLMDKAVHEPYRLITYHALRHSLSSASTANGANSTNSDARINEKSGSGVSSLHSYHVVAPMLDLNSTDARSELTFSIGLLHFAVLPRLLLRDYVHGWTVATALKSTAASIPQCQVVVFNSFLVDRLLQPPILVGDGRVPAFALQPRAYQQCLNKIVRAGYENFEAPLMTSHLRHLID